MQSSFEVDKILFQIVCITASLMWPYLYCYYATFACDRVASIGDTVYNSNWYKQSVEMQRRNILIIAYSQQPVHFTGFNLFPCTLEIFGHVSIKFIPLCDNFKYEATNILFIIFLQLFRKSCSFYLIFRSVSEL